MEQQLFGPHSPTDATADTMTSTSRDDGADRSTTPPADATPSRHLYTMTVDDVVAELLTYELQRDTRTVQRWCKSGKLRAIIDHEHGDRYLIDPASVRDTVAALLQERDSQAPRQDAMTRPRHDSVGTHTRQPDIDPRQYHFTPHSMRDMVTDSPTETTTTDTTSEQRRDEVAALERRVAELEKEKAMLSVDKEVREQMVEYLKGNFQQMLDQALERTEQLGKLQAENAHLRALLPAGQAAQSTADRQPSYQAEQSSMHEHSTGPETPPASIHRRAPWSPD